MGCSQLLMVIVCFPGYSELKIMLEYTDSRGRDGCLSREKGVVRWKGHRGPDYKDSTLLPIKGGRTPVFLASLLSSWILPWKWHVSCLIPFYWLSCKYKDDHNMILVTLSTGDTVLKLLKGEYHFWGQFFIHHSILQWGWMAVSVPFVRS